MIQIKSVFLHLSLFEDLSGHVQLVVLLAGVDEVIEESGGIDLSLGEILASFFAFRPLDVHLFRDYAHHLLTRSLCLLFFYLRDQILSDVGLLSKAGINIGVVTMSEVLVLLVENDVLIGSLLGLLLDLLDLIVKSHDVG